MAFQVKSFVELQNNIRANLELAMDEAFEELLDGLISIIETCVYQDTPAFYDRTHDISKRENWCIKSYKYAGKIYRQIYFKDNCLSTLDSDDPHSPNAYIHGNNYFGQIDETLLLKILNNDAKSGDLFGFTHVNRIPFWDEFVVYCDSNIDDIIKKHCNAHGISI